MAGTKTQTGSAAQTAPPHKTHTHAHDTHKRGARVGGAAGKPAAPKPNATTPKGAAQAQTCPQPAEAGSRQTQGRTAPDKRTATGPVPMEAEHPVTSAQETVAEPYDPVADQLKAGWILQERRKKGKAKPARRVEPEPESAELQGPSNKRKKKKKNRSQRRQGRQMRAALEKTGVLQQQKPPVSEAVQAVAGPSAASRAPPKGNYQPRATPGCSRPEAQAPAKRARLDETISPRGPPKRQRLEPTVENARAYSDAVKADLLVAITGETTGFLNQKQGEEVQRFLEETLMELVTQPDAEKGHLPGFWGKPSLAGGALRLWCDDQYTLDWLKQLMTTFTLSTGEKVVVRRQSELGRRIRCGIMIPGAWTDTYKIARALNAMNPWAGVRQWLLYNVFRQESGMFIVVGVPEAMVQPLLDHGRRLKFLLGSVYLRFQGPKGKYLDLPPQAGPAPVEEAREAKPEPMNSASGVEPAADLVAASPASQNSGRADPAPDCSEEELLREPSEVGEDFTQELGNLFIGEGAGEAMTTEVDNTDGATPFFGM